MAFFQTFFFSLSLSRSYSISLCFYLSPPVCRTPEIPRSIDLRFFFCVFLTHVLVFLCLSSAICLCLCFCLSLSLSLLFLFLGLPILYRIYASNRTKHRSSASVLGSCFSTHVLVSLQLFIIFTPEICFTFVLQDAVRWQQMNKQYVSILYGWPASWLSYIPLASERRGKWSCLTDNYMILYVIIITFGIEWD